MCQVALMMEHRNHAITIYILGIFKSEHFRLNETGHISQTMNYIHSKDEWRILLLDSRWTPTNVWRVNL